MISTEKKNVLGILVAACDYETVVERTVQAARQRQPFAIAAAAVHSVMEGVFNKAQQYRLNQFDFVLPDGQPVRWALNLLHGAGLAKRVYGPELTRLLLERAEKENLGVYFYGSTEEILSALRSNLEKRFPRLRISGMEPSRFRRLSHQERDRVVQQIRESGASLVFVGLGCPRQEVWAFEYKEKLSMPILAVGGAFGVLAGKVPQAPAWMQARGLEWLFRLSSEPRRLWRRYLLLNPAYTALITLQAVGLRAFPTRGIEPSEELLYG
jgi:N-acetylglucosaminyldiphosphoundecaprenol N-acetyl-beta-D-mannosaminyltransferase